MIHLYDSYMVPIWVPFSCVSLRFHGSLKDWGNPTQSATWRHEGDGGWPFKDFSPLLLVPGSHAPSYVLLDYVHIFHLGYGLDCGASSIVLLALLGHFGSDRKLDNCLHQAYQQYDLWCKANHRTTAIDEFSRHAFGMGGCLNSKLFSYFDPCYFCADLLVTTNLIQSTILKTH